MRRPNAIEINLIFERERQEYKQLVEKEKWDLANEYNILDCIECGLCSYVCPAKRDLVHLIKYGKSRIKNQEAGCLQ